jgi:deoxyribodipyrimidine photo-lyase
MRAVWWVRRDLRLGDNQALQAAAAADELIPVFCWDEDEPGVAARPWAPGAASRWWLHHSLAALKASLRARGSDLLILRGDTMTALRRLKPDVVYCSRRYEPAEIAREAAVRAGLNLESFGGKLLREPDALVTGAGTPYSVFTPYWNAFVKGPDFGKALAAPKTLPPLPPGVHGESLAALGLLPRVAWDDGIAAAWTPGEAGAQAALAAFLAHAAKGYEKGRDLPAAAGTSRLSPHLAFGEVSARSVWKAASGNRPFLRQLAWRDFAAQLLVHQPHSSDTALKPAYDRFPWRDDYAPALKAWQQGQTGYPIVDAGMRELWHTGWMHNRVRMIAASFLVKHLLIPWQEGARWFWDTLVDADLANNSFGWQWSAGSGADAAPYFRVFNPYIQAKKFDAGAAYVKKWVPEAGTRSYVKPIVDHDAARLTALKAYDRFKKLTG